MQSGRQEQTRERVEWELPAGLLKDFRHYCDTYDLTEEEAVSTAIERYLAERLLEEGE